jgi:pyruvate dehydrogenase E1 component alpha subunit
MLKEMIDLPVPELLGMYRRMVLIRRFEEVAVEQRLAGKIYGVIHPYIGQEAVAVGVCAHLKQSDRITSTHRGHGHCIAKGADVKRMMAELFGRRAGYCKGKGGSMHIADFGVGMLGANGIVGAGLPIAAGAALAARFDGSDAVAVGFFGDGATGEGEFHEALNLSALWKLPVVWVCENNGYASGTPTTEGVPEGGVAGFAGGYGMPGVRVNGNDVLAVGEAAREAVARARAGEGPTLLEAMTFRRTAHVLRDKLPKEARPADLLASWEDRDPITAYESVLISHGVFDREAAASLRASVERELDEALEFADSSPFPEPEEALEDLYAGYPLRSAR